MHTNGYLQRRDRHPEHPRIPVEQKQWEERDEKQVRPEKGTEECDVQWTDGRAYKNRRR